MFRIDIYFIYYCWLRGLDLNQGPSGYEPDELPDCSTPRYMLFYMYHIIYSIKSFLYLNVNSKMNSGLSIVIPTYNEDKNLQLLISEIVKSTKIKNYEIIVVDDNSSDKTYYIAQKLKKYKNFNFHIRLDKIRDLSQSCILGFNKSKFQNILVMDADLQHNPKYINIFYRTFIKNNFDILIGCREFKRNLLKLNSQFLRYLASNILVILFNKILGFKTIDPMSGFFLFKKNYLLIDKIAFLQGVIKFY